MKVLRLKDLDPSRRVVGDGFISHRFLLDSDLMGFGLHKTLIPEGDRKTWHYKHHLEACYCISGRGVLADDSGNTYDIVPDTCYVLDQNDRHHFRATEDTVLISVFNPPLSGAEIHRPDGSYAASGPDYFAMAERVMAFQSVYDCAEFLQTLNINKNDKL